MVQTNAKVVAFDSDGSNRPGDRDQSTHLIIVKCWGTFTKPFMQLVDGFFERTDDELFNLSEKAENSSSQTVYFDAMRYLRKERESIRSGYAEGVSQRYNDFWAGKLEMRPASDEELNEETGSLSLVANEDLEEGLAITTMISKGNNLWYAELFGLDKRLSFIAGKKEINKEENPIGPAQLCFALEDVLNPLDLDLEIKLFVYKLFDQVVLGRLGDIYQTVNGFLIEENILPKFANPIRNSAGKSGFRFQRGTASGSRNSTDIFDERGQIIEEAGDGAFIDAFYTMRNLMGGWRAAHGVIPMGQDDDNGSTYQTHDVLNALSNLQFIGEGTPVVREQAMSAQTGVKVFIADELKKSHPEGDRNRPLGRVEEDVIDMVGIIFDYILEDDNLADSIKALIGRLQIPIVKTAILDKSFFAKKMHPARQLLNKLAKAGVATGDSDASAATPLYKKIQSVVTRILEELDHDISLFATLLEELTLFLEKEEQRSYVVEQRTKQTTHSKEQLVLAKKIASYEVVKRLQGREIPGIIRSFLDNNWKDVLVLAFLRREKEPESWHSMLGVIGQLIASITPQSDSVEEKRTLQTIPRLLKDIQIGLEKISCHPVKMSSIFEDIKVCHIAIFGEAILDIDWAENQQGEAQANLVSIVQNNMGRQGTGSSEVALNEILSVIEQPEANEKDKHYLLAESMEIGQWVDFEESEETSIRGKLSWKSQVTSSCVFVNNKGTKVMEKSIQEIATALREGKASIVKEVKIPLMDRALAAMTKTLNKPAQQEPVHARRLA